MELVRSLGADKVIDYTQQDFAQGGETYDLILHVLGKGSFSRCQGSPLRRSGTQKGQHRHRGAACGSVRPAKRKPTRLTSINLT